MSGCGREVIQAGLEHARELVIGWLAGHGSLDEHESADATRPQAGKRRCHGGMLVTTDGVQTLSGKVTGGTGAFAGATGRIAAKVLTPTKGIVTHYLQHGRRASLIKS
jgi:hypothetical protein